MHGRAARRRQAGNRRVRDRYRRAGTPRAARWRLAFKSNRHQAHRARPRRDTPNPIHLPGVLHRRTNHLMRLWHRGFDARGKYSTPARAAKKKARTGSLKEHIGDRRILNLLGQYMKRTSERGGWFFDHDRGISLGCPLSPLLGCSSCTSSIGMASTGLFYVRFMDDILVLAPSRWKLRRAVKAVNEVLASLRLEKHPDKTFIGRIARGFDFLGYRFGPAGLSIAKATIEKFVEHASRLYEQERGKAHGSSPLGMYVRRWVGWAKAGVPVALSGLDNPLGSDFLTRDHVRTPPAGQYQPGQTDR
jgi:hypothetical protein